MTLSTKNGGYAFFNEVKFNVFYVIMQKATNFKWAIHQKFN